MEFTALLWLALSVIAGGGYAVELTKLPILVKALRHEHAYIRGRAAEVLGEKGFRAKAAVPALIEILKDEDATVRYQAVHALGRIRQEANITVPALSGCLQDDNSKVRSAAVPALAAFGPLAIPTLLNTLQDKRGHVRAGACQALGLIKDKAAIPALLEVLRHDQDDGALLEAATALAQFGPAAKDAIPVLRRAFRKKDGVLGENAPYLLSAFGPPAIPALIELVKDKGWRTMAISSLGNIGLMCREQICPEATDAVATLIRALSHKDETTRWHAATALEKFGPQAKAAIPRLTKALKDRNGSVRVNAACALLRIDPNNEDSIPALIQALQDKDGGVRYYALLQLGRFQEVYSKAKGAIPVLIDLLQDKDPLIRNFAAITLADFSWEKDLKPSLKAAIPALERLLQDDDAGVRVSAAYALEMIRDKK